MRRSLARPAFFPRVSLVGLLALGTGSLGVSCAGLVPKAGPDMEVGVSPSKLSEEPGPALPGPSPIGAQYLPSQVIGSSADAATTPYFARRGSDGLALFGVSGKWFTRAVGADGTPKAAAPIEVGAYTDGVLASLKPVGDGYLAVWIDLVAKNYAIKLLVLDAAGNPKGPASLVTQVADSVTALEALPNEKGAVLVWFVPKAHGGDVIAAPFNGGKIDGAAQTIARGVLSWDGVSSQRGAVVAVVEPAGAAAAPKGAGKKPAGGPKGKTKVEVAPSRSGELGKVVLYELDTHAKAASPITVSAEPTAQIDVDIAEVGGKYLLAWTDERNIDPAVFLATVEPGGKLAVPPHRAAAPIGGEALIALVAEPYAPGVGSRGKRAMLTWEDQLPVTRDGRTIHMATVSADGAVGGERATMTFSSDGAPPMAADGDGFAAVTLAPYRDLPDGLGGDSKEAPIWPAFVRFGPDLKIIASEPLRAEPFAAREGAVPYLQLPPSCSGGSCLVLASAAVVPPKDPKADPEAAPLALVSLPVRESPWKAPAARQGIEAPPRATGVSSLYDGDHLSRVASIGLGDKRALVGWVTYFLDGSGVGRASGGKAKPKGDGNAATISVRPIGDDGTPGKTVVVSQKAVSIGGISLAATPRDNKKPEVAMAWAALDRGEPQVFMTRLGENGEKLTQKNITSVSRKKKNQIGEVSDVSLAYAGGESGGGDAWILAWTDTRDGNAEIYTAKVDRALGKMVADKRLTDAPGASTEPQLAVRGKDVVVVWADARAKPDEGNSDIYVAHLKAGTLEKTGPETRIFASANHSHAPQIVATPKGFLVSWIEDYGDGSNAAESGLRIAELDDQGGVIGAPQLVRPDSRSDVKSSALTCGPKLCRAIVASGIQETMVLSAFELVPGANAGPVKSLATLTGAPQDISPSFSGPTGGSLFFSHDATGGAGRVRWMQLVWP